MKTRPFHSSSSLLTIGMSLALAWCLGCGKQEQSKQGEETYTEHDDGLAGSMLMVTTEPATPQPGEPVALRLMIHDAAGAMIKDFETVHEKKLHLIIARDGLDQFAHLHPEVDGAGNITATYTFPTAGTYRLYADHKLTGHDPAALMAEVNVSGTPASIPTLAPNTPGRVNTDDLTADIAIENAKSGGTTRISFTLFDATGDSVTDLQPYLGAMGHLVVLSADGTQYVHSHPLAGEAASGAVAFEAHFPQPGIYKGWGEFQRSGMVHDVPFVVEIE